MVDSGLRPHHTYCCKDGHLDRKELMNDPNKGRQMGLEKVMRNQASVLTRFLCYFCNRNKVQLLNMTSEAVKIVPQDIETVNDIAEKICNTDVMISSLMIKTIFEVMIRPDHGVPSLGSLTII